MRDILTASRLRRAVVGADSSFAGSLSIVVFRSRLRNAVAALSASVTELNRFGDCLFRDKAYAFAYECFALASVGGRDTSSEINLGRCEIQLGRPDSAEARARSIVASDPGRSLGWRLLGEALAFQKQYVEAIWAFQRAISIGPAQAAQYRLLGETWERAGEPALACSAYEQAIEIDPDDIRILRSLIFTKRRSCSWGGLSELSARLRACVEKGVADVSPFDFLLEESTAPQQMVCASRRAGKVFEFVGRKRQMMSAGKRSTVGNLRVGFVSHGFGLHPTTILTTNLFEELRSLPIEVHLFATNSDPDTAPRRRIAAAAHTFHDVVGLAPEILASRIKEEGIEVLFDLDGYNRARIPEVFAYRPSPIQVNWLAYPGTTGASFIDYVIADRFVLPESLQPFFSERVTYISRCFQSTDPTRVVAEPPPREACGLPIERVVFVCFNAIFKIGPRSFARMMRILSAVEGSVLWLLNESEQACANLRNEARAAGIEPGRLVFMEKLSHASYLARYRHADLFLDTEYYNAHTTASDALWAGCPVLTRPGDTFAARVAGSLNHHLGMDEMNVVDDDGFVNAAVRYGNDASLRAATREKLVRQKLTSGVFDMTGFVRDFTALLVRMVEHHRAGGKAVNFPRD